MKTFMNLGSKLLMSALLLAGMSSVVRGDVIVQVISGAEVDAFAPEVLGQSFTTPSGGPWYGISFNFFSDVPAATPLAAGDAYLLTQEYLGPVAGLSSSTPGFLAESTGIVGGQWVFDSGVILNPNAQYWIYIDTPITSTGSGTGQTPAQQAYFIDEETGNFCTCNTSLTNFELDGSVVPEPGTWLTGFSGLAFVAVLKLRHRNSPRRDKSPS